MIYKPFQTTFTLKEFFQYFGKKKFFFLNVEIGKCHLFSLSYVCMFKGNITK